MTPVLQLSGQLLLSLQLGVLMISLSAFLLYYLQVYRFYKHELKGRRDHHGIYRQYHHARGRK